jgi:hypothetical protein
MPPPPLPPLKTLEDGTEILHDQTVGHTHWCLYRHPQTKTLNVAITQYANVVSVEISNLRVLLNELMPPEESTLPPEVGRLASELRDSILATGRRGGLCGMSGKTITLSLDAPL